MLPVLLWTSQAWGDPEGSEEDLEDILAALQADAEEAEAASVDPTSATSSAVGGTGGAPGRGAMNPDLSFIADVALAAFSNPDEAAQGGAHDPTVNGFNLQQLELAVGAAVDPYLRMDGNIVFGLFGVEIEEIYATTLAMPGTLQLRAGQFLTRFGRANPTHPHTWSFVDQPLALGRLMGGEGNRGLGVEASVLAPLPWYVEIVGSETMAGGAATARSFYGSNDLGVSSPADLQSTVAIKQFFPLGDDLSLMWGLSWASGPNPTGRNRTELYGTDLYLKYRPITRGSFTQLSLHAEWIARRYQVPDDVLTDGTGFVSGAWRFSRRWGVAGRYEYGSPTTNGLGDEVVDPTDPAWLGFRQRISANLTFWPTEFSRIRAQVSGDTLDWVPDPVLAGFLALEFSAGAHGAHAF